MNRKDICKNIIQSIYEYITNPDKLEPHREKNHFVRKRKLSLYHVIMYLLFSSKASMFQNLARIRSELGSIDFPDISKQALSKARQFINPSLFKELYYLSVDLFYKLIPSRKLWNGYHLFAIDGSKIELPNLFFASTFWTKLQNIFGHCCKTFLDIVACPNWTKLQCPGWLRNKPAVKPLQTLFNCYSTRYGNGSSEFSSSCACSLKY